MVGDVLAGRNRAALESLKGQFNSVAANLDMEPQTYFQTVVRLAIDTLEGRLTRAFVDEMTPPITEPGKAWNYNVNTLVRGGLALSLCAERPAREFPAVFFLAPPFSAMIAEHSPTTVSVSNAEDPEVVEMARVGVFQAPEVFVRRGAVEQISNDLRPLLTRLPMTGQIAQTIQHFYALLTAPMMNSDLAVLRGYL